MAMALGPVKCELRSRRGRLSPDKRGGFNGSMRHWLEPHPEGFQRLGIVRDG